MSLNAATIEVLLAKGLTAADLLEVARALEKKRDNTNAERQARHRAKRKGNGRYSNGVTPPNDIDILTPHEVSEAKASSPRPWACPEGVDPGHWADFRRNRKTKRCTDSETAYRAQLRELERLADDEWPPGRLVQFAAERGWASINDPRKPRYDQQHHPSLGKTSAALAIGPGWRDDQPF